jgi:protein-tyrosine phosphatase
VPAEIVKFIDEALERGTSVLIHSRRGQSRASVVVLLYLMESFRWSLLKSLEFVNSRRPDLEIRANFLQQLQSYTKRVVDGVTGKRVQRSEEWNQVIVQLPEIRDLVSQSKIENIDKVRQLKKKA